MKKKVIYIFLCFITVFICLTSIKVQAVSGPMFPIGPTPGTGGGSSSGGSSGGSSSSGTVTTTKEICTYVLPIPDVTGENYYLKISRKMSGSTYAGTMFEIKYGFDTLIVNADQAYGDGFKITSKQVSGITEPKEVNIMVKDIGPQSGLDSYYTLDKLKTITSCPKFVWYGMDYNEHNFGIILSDTIPETVPHNITANGIHYNNKYDEYIVGDAAILDKSDFDNKLKRYNELINKFDDLIEDGVAYRCSEFLAAYNDSYDEVRGLEDALENYVKLNTSVTFDNTHGKQVLKEITPAKSRCDTHNYDIEGSSGGSYNEGELQSGCEIIPPVIRKWINNILNFVKYVALVLVIALGALDFIQAAGTGEPDSIKKAGQKFVKRLIAVVVLFLVPVLVDFILNMINIYGVDPNNPTCL